MPAAKIPVRRDPEVADFYRSGLTIKEVAARLGVSESSVTTSLTRHGVQRRPAKPRSTWTDSVDQKRQVAKMYLGGISVRAIARKIQVKQKTVTDALTDQGVAIRPTGHAAKIFSAAQETQLAAEYAAGADLAELARRHGASAPTVSKAIQAGGGTVRPGGTSAFWTEERVAEAIAKYQSGMNQTDVAASMGVRNDAVCRILYGAGVLTRMSHRGGRFVRKDGYVVILPTDEDLPFCPPGRRGRIMEHRLVMAKTLGRPLAKHETVHHIDLDHGNNALENLQLRVGKHGAGAAFSCQDCGSQNVSAIPLAG